MRWSIISTWSFCNQHKTCDPYLPWNSAFSQYWTLRHCSQSFYNRRVILVIVCVQYNHIDMKMRLAHMIKQVIISFSYSLHWKKVKWIIQTSLPIVSSEMRSFHLTAGKWDFHFMHLSVVYGGGISVSFCIYLIMHSILPNSSMSVNPVSDLSHVFYI